MNIYRFLLFDHTYSKPLDSELISFLNLNLSISAWSPSSPTDLVIEALLSGEISSVGNHMFTVKDSVSHNLDKWCHLWRHFQCKGHLPLSHWNGKLYVIKCVHQYRRYILQMVSTSERNVYLLIKKRTNPPKIIFMVWEWFLQICHLDFLDSLLKSSLPTRIIVYFHLFKTLHDNSSPRQDLEKVKENGWNVYVQLRIDIKVLRSQCSTTSKEYIIYFWIYFACIILIGEWVIKLLTPTDTDNIWHSSTQSQILPMYQLLQALLLQFITLSEHSMHYLPNTSHPKNPEAPLLWYTWLRCPLPCHKKGVFPCSSQSESWLFWNQE